MKEWYEEENKRIGAEEEARLKELGFEPLISMKKGENNLEIMNPKSAPRLITTKYGERMVFHVKLNGVEGDWAVNKRNPLYKDIVESMVSGTTIMKVLKTGEGTDTRYELI